MYLKSKLTVFTAMLIAMAPFHAYAQEDRNVGVQDRPRPEYDPLGLRFGGFDLNASVEVGAESTDNLFATETLAQDDIIFSLRPSATLASHWSRHALVVSGGADVNSHQDFSNEDTETGYVSAYGRLDVAESTELSGNLRAAHEVEPRSGPDALVNATTPVEYDRTEVSASAQHTINRVRVIGSASAVDYDFDDVTDANTLTTIDQDFRDRSETAVTGRVEVAISPRVAVVGQVTADEREYDVASTPSLDSEGRTILAGIRVDLSNLIRGELTAGQFSRDYDLETVEGTAVDANLQWFVTGLTTVSFNASRNVEEGTASTTAPFVNTRMGARIDHELLRNLILSGDVGFARREYEPPIDREDETTYITAEAKYLMNRRVAVRAGFVHEENDTSGADAPPNRNFDVNRFFAGLIFRL